MPAATTHVEFARDVYQSLSTKSFVDDTLFYLGSQGPDLFFFSRASGFLPGSLKKVGDRMHVDKVKETLEYLYHYSRLNPLLKNYYYGYLCHYALDSTCHPIVFHNARKIHEEDGSNESEAHIALEAIVDLWCLEKHHKSIDDYNVFDDLLVTGSKKKELAKMYHSLFQDVYGLAIPSSKIQETITSIYRITKLIRPTSTKKYNAVYRIESLLKVPRTVSSMMLNNKSMEETNILNKNHQEYICYGQDNKVDTSSFEDLYNEALLKVKKWIEDDCVPEPVDLDFSGQYIYE